jgi:hypothetical protein
MISTDQSDALRISDLNSLNVAVSYLESQEEEEGFN